MTFSPYIHFQGQCAEAMTFYADLFGANDLYMMRYSDVQDPAAPKSDRIMHGHMSVDGGAFMASDYPEGVKGDDQKGSSVYYNCKTVENGKRVYYALLDGGAAIHPFGPSFFSPGFGMVKDRFGTHWIVATPET